MAEVTNDLLDGMPKPVRARLGDVTDGQRATSNLSVVQGKLELGSERVERRLDLAEA